MNGCPYCLNNSVSNNQCINCGSDIKYRNGIPSTTTVQPNKDSRGELQSLVAVRKENLDKILGEIREDYMDGGLVDRFFKTRTVCWRVLVSEYLSGKGLVIGDHEEKVGIVLSELLDDVYTVDSDLMSLQAQKAIAKATDNEVKPVHSTYQTLPFPSHSFDTIVLSCRGSRLPEYLSQLEPLMSENGVIILLTDGWTREIGITDLFDLGEPLEGIYNRVFSSLHSHSYGLHQIIRQRGLSVHDQFALLSTSRHENQRGFNVHSVEAHDWLINRSDKTASSIPLRIARTLSQIALNLGIIRQCYPRYLFVCQRSEDKETNREACTSGILLDGKNRSTYLNLRHGNIQSIRKIPNSRRQGVLNEQAQAVIECVDGPISNTLPTSEIRHTEFGPERIEQPVSGTPLDQTIEPTPESIDKHLDAVFEWLCEFQRSTATKRINKQPEDIERELAVESANLTSSPAANHEIEILETCSHGDLFGSNIYLNQGTVSGVIDWEWGKIKSNSITDPGFFLLQLTELMNPDFEEAFMKLFIKDNKYSRIVYSYIDHYCTDMSIHPRSFATYLPISYINRSKEDLNINKRLDIDWPSRVRHVWCHQGTIQSRIEDA